MNTYALDPILQSAIADVMTRLNTFAQDPLFSQNWKLIFGNTNITPQQFLSLVNQLPNIQIRTANELSGAKGAFADQNNTIYLSDSLFQPNQSVQLTATLLEEIGHYLDAKVNKEDTKGDEGELFSAVVRGIKLNESELTRIRNENDQTVITLNNKILTVEQSYLGLESYIITTDYQCRPEWERKYYNPQIVDNNVVWLGYDGQIYLQDITQLINHPIDNGNSQVSGNSVLSVYDGHDYEVYFVNEYFTIQITDNEIDDYSPSVSGNNVVWISSSGYGSKIYLWNGETISQVNYFADSYYDYYDDHYNEIIFVNDNIDVQISGNYIVWQDDYVTLELSKPGSTSRYKLIWASELWIAAIHPEPDALNKLPITTPQSDCIQSSNGNNYVGSTFANLQQNDTIEGGAGIDTLVIKDGNQASKIAINANSSNNQILNIPGTKVTGFERFDLSKFLGVVNFIGSANDDWISSGLGIDQLAGGQGNDTYVINNSRDTVTEKPREGYFDIIQSSVTYTLPNNVEALTLTGSNAINGTGNDLGNSIIGNSGNNLLKGLDGDDYLLGNSGNDTLVGGLGSDRLTGGDGSDQFVMGTGAVFNPNNFGIDTITDFASGSDKIVLSKASFPTLNSLVGTLKAEEFAIVYADEVSDLVTLISGSSSSRIVYNMVNSELFYCPQGINPDIPLHFYDSSFDPLINKIFAVVEGITGIDGLNANDFAVQA